MLTPELADEICELVAQCVPVARICAMEGMPNKATLYRWKRDNAEFSDKYARAREDRADARQDEMDDIVQRMLAGEIKPDAARVAIDAIKWQMGKEKPKIYGEKIQIDARHEHVNGLSDAELERIASGRSEGAAEAAGDPSKLN
jgi:hypothetical protein